MHRQSQMNTNGTGFVAAKSNSELPLTKSNFSLEKLSKSCLNPPTVEEVRVASLKVLALTLLHQVEALEKQIAAESAPELNLQKEVQRFEAAIIRSALEKTGGRQRRAARLLGVKVTTLNTKIKRHKIVLDETQGENETLTLPS
jgi:DNA-binding NtrC family response regulator